MSDGISSLDGANYGQSNLHLLGKCGTGFISLDPMNYLSEMNSEYKSLTLTDTNIYIYVLELRLAQIQLHSCPILRTFVILLLDHRRNWFVRQRCQPEAMSSIADGIIKGL